MSLLGIIFALIAAFFGGLFERETGFLLGLVVGYSFGAIIQLSGKVKELERRIKHIPLSRPISETERPTRIEPSPVAVAEQGQPRSEAAAPRERAVDSSMYQPVAAPQPVVETAQAQTQQASWHTGESLVDKIFTRIKSFFTDGNVVVKVGVLVLFVGVGFLLKYAAAHSMLPVQLRVAGIALGGIALLIVGWRLREAKRIYALLLQGGGVGVLYLTVFGAAKLYHLLPLGFALVMMVALVVLSGILAVLQNAKYLAFYGAAGGFLARRPADL